MGNGLRFRDCFENLTAADCQGKFYMVFPRLHCNHNSPVTLIEEMKLFYLQQEVDCCVF